MNDVAFFLCFHLLRCFCGLLTADAVCGTHRSRAMRCAAWMLVVGGIVMLASSADGGQSDNRWRSVWRRTNKKEDKTQALEVAGASFSRTFLNAGGFHRTLVTRVSGLSVDDILRQLLEDDSEKCADYNIVLEIGVLEAIPIEAYVDADEVFELGRLQQFAGTGAALLSKGRLRQPIDALFSASLASYMDVEAPAYSASLSALDDADRLVASVARLRPVSQKRNWPSVSAEQSASMSLSLNLSLPVHARYAAPGEIERSSVVLRHQDVRWIARALCEDNDVVGLSVDRVEGAAWRPVVGIAYDDRVSDLAWTVPVGISADESLVGYATAAAALVATAVVACEMFSSTSKGRLAFFPSKEHRSRRY